MRKKLVIVGLILFVLTCLITLAFSAKKEKSLYKSMKIKKESHTEILRV